MGPPMPGTDVKILSPDEFGVGEVICKGPSVMLGYYNDPEETERTIVNGWLHTGDYGYIDKEGYIYLMGRKKNVIITRNGKNVFPEEIEYYLMRKCSGTARCPWGSSAWRSASRPSPGNTTARARRPKPAKHFQRS